MTEDDAKKLVSDLVHELDYDVWKELFLPANKASRARIKSLTDIVLRHTANGPSKAPGKPAKASKPSGRVFAPITVEALRAKLEAAFREEPGDYGFSSHLVTEKLGKDLKVEFDTENFESGLDYKGERSKFMGFHTLDNGLTFCGMYAGGDWEYPVHWIVYWDGKKLRGYIPTEGNPYNTDTKRAYGNDEKADAKNAKKRWPDVYKSDEVESDDFDADEDAMIEDIKQRLVPA